MTTKKELIEKCRNILYSYGTNQALKDSDRSFLLDKIFPLHPRWLEKTGGIPVRAVIVHRHPDYHNLCFALVRNDNSIVDISFTECINRTGLKEDIQKACKSAVDDIYEADRKVPIEKTISEWVKNFELGEISVAKFLDYITAEDIRFSDLEMIQNFREFYGRGNI